MADGERVLSVMTDSGLIIRDSGWRCVADVIMSYHGFVSRGRVYGVIVDAVTLEQVYPPKEVDGTGTRTD